MGAVVEIWFESLIPFLLKDSHIVHWLPSHSPGKQASHRPGETLQRKKIRKPNYCMENQNKGLKVVLKEKAEFV